MKIKICGISRYEDILAVNEAMPDYIGFVFATSRRRVTAEKAAELSEMLDVRIKKVGVFVDSPTKETAQAAKIAGLDVIQLHGNEDSEYIKDLRRLVHCEIWKAIKVTESMTIPDGADMLLFDGEIPGSGKSFNWNSVNTDRKFFLAGGLDCENVEKGIELLKPYGVDVSSGVETRGTKDKDKILAFVRAVRAKEGNA